jgi:cyclopropane-fatty-acyl-phospholipid synthase
MPGRSFLFFGAMSNMTGMVVNDTSDAEQVVPKTEQSWAYAVQFRSGEHEVHGSGQPLFVIRVPDRAYWTTLVQANAYSVGVAFVRGDFQIDGDLLQAIRWWHARRGTTAGREWAMRAFSRLRPGSWLRTASRARRNVRFHYDRSNTFYQQFLDRRLVYSCAYFADPCWSLDDAQLAKLDHICHKLDLSWGDRFLDIGCGWGALVIRAAERYGVDAVGCTVSSEQFAYAARAVQTAGLTEHVDLYDRDYRDFNGSFDKIASVGMFEHVGRRLGEYFRTVSRLLQPEGLFLNHGIVRPSSMREDSSTVFLQSRVFPGAELASLSDVIREAEHAGFEVLDVENLRPHYALTCAKWVERLQAHRNTSILTVDPETYRTWLLYLAAAGVSFERAHIEVHQILFAKRSQSSARRLTRKYMYEGGSAPLLRFDLRGPR